MKELGHTSIISVLLCFLIASDIKQERNASLWEMALNKKVFRKKKNVPQESLVGFISFLDVQCPVYHAG